MVGESSDTTQDYYKTKITKITNIITTNNKKNIIKKELLKNKDLLLLIKTMEQEKQQPNGQEQEQPKIKLVDVQVTNENDAFNLLISFINIAHKRGAFTIDESAKIWECIKIFQKPESES